MLILCESPHRMSHSLSPNQMKMDVKHRLSAVNSCVGDDTIAVLVDPFFLCKFSRSCDEMTYQLLILRFQRVDRFNVPVRHDQ